MDKAALDTSNILRQGKTTFVQPSPKEDKEVLDFLEKLDNHLRRRATVAFLKSRCKTNQQISGKDSIG